MRADQPAQERMVRYAADAGRLAAGKRFFDQIARHPARSHAHVPFGRMENPEGLIAAEQGDMSHELRKAIDGHIREFLAGDATIDCPAIPGQRPGLQRLQWDSGPQQCIRTKRPRTSSVDFFRQCHNIRLRTTASTENREDDPLGRATFGSCAGGSSDHSGSMRFPSSNCLRKADESTAFVTLAWDELFHSETPDSYRPRLFDTRLLIAELAELAALAQDDSRWTPHVRLVQNEISESARLESRWVANTAWTTAFVTTIVNARDLREIEDLTGLFLATSTPAIFNLMEALRHDSRNLPRNKKKVLEILKLLATNARILGFVNIQDNFTGDEELYSENCSTVVDHICASLEIQTRDFNCIVRMRGDKSTIQSAITNTRVRISGKRDFPLDENGRSFKNGTNNGEVPVSIQTKATSHFNAAVQALKECRRVVDITNLYNNRSSIAIPDYHSSQA